MKEEGYPMLDVPLFLSLCEPIPAFFCISEIVIYLLHPALKYINF